MPGVGELGGGLAGGLLADAGMAARGNILAELGKKAANAAETRQAVEMARRLEQQRQQSLLTRVPQYLLPYSH
jgi:hypothetical protein